MCRSSRTMSGDTARNRSTAWRGSITQTTRPAPARSKSCSRTRRLVSTSSMASTVAPVIADPSPMPAAVSARGTAVVGRPTSVHRPRRATPEGSGHVRLMEWGGPVDQWGARKGNAMSSRSRLPLSAAALVVLVAVAAATTALWAGVRSIVIDESDRLLKEHTTEAGLVIASLFSGTGADLSVLVTATPPSLEDTSRFNQAAGSLLGPARTISVVEVRTGAVVVVDGVGVAPAEGTVVADDVASLARRAITARGMVSAVIVDGGARRLAFAVPAGGGLVVYETLASRSEERRVGKE